MFNSQEEDYEIIDNIAPETVGVKYRIADRGYVRTAADVARFIAFNLFETTLAQKGAVLGSPAVDPDDPNRWDLKLAREQSATGCSSEALADEDPLRAEIEGRDERSQELRSDLAALALTRRSSRTRRYARCATISRCATQSKNARSPRRAAYWRSCWCRAAT